MADDPTLEIGDRVLVLPPFDVAYPGIMTIDGINPDTGSYQIAGDRDFDAMYLQKVEP